MSFTSNIFPNKRFNSFTQKIEDEKANVVELRTEQEGMSVYAILQIEPAKYSAYQQAFKEKQTVDITTFGKILHSGFGKPSFAIKQEMHQKFGMYAEELES